MKTKLNANPVNPPAVGVSRSSRLLLVGVVALLLGGLFILSGCEHTGGEFSKLDSGQAEGTNSAAVPAAASSRLQEGDVVKVVFEGDTNLNAVVKVQLNGSITLPLAGELKAAGKTQQELQADLRQVYKPLLQVNEINVSIISTAAAVYVSGAVLRPGRVSMDRPLTALEAIMEAGGFDLNRSKPSAVVILRIENGNQKRYTVDMRKALRGEDPTPFQLRAFDIVHVPEKTFNF